MKKRFQIDLTETDLNRLEPMKETVGAVSFTQVVRDALRFYDWMIRQAHEGRVFKSVDPESGETLLVEFPTIQSLR